MEAFQEAIKRKDGAPLTYTPHNIAKDDVDRSDIKVFPDNVYEEKDSHPPDIKLDTLGKGRISLPKRSPSLHSESDA